MGETADILEKYNAKGSEIRVQGKIKTRTNTTEDRNQCYLTETTPFRMIRNKKFNDFGA